MQNGNHSDQKPVLKEYVIRFRELLSEINDSRLFLVNLETVTAAVLQKSFLPKYFGIFGLIYGCRLAADLDCFIDDIFVSSFEKALEDKERLSRMVNDSIWFTLNLSCLIVNPTLAIWLTVSGLGFDIVHELFKTIRDEVEDKASQDKINKITENKITQDKISQDKPSQDTTLRDKTTVSKEQNHSENNHMENLKNHLYDLSMTLSFSIGSSLCLFPATALVGSLFLTIGTVLVAKDTISSCWDYFFSTKHTDSQTQILATKKLDSISSSKKVLSQIEPSEVIKKNEKKAENEVKNEDVKEAVHSIEKEVKNEDVKEAVHAIENEVKNEDVKEAVHAIENEVKNEDVKEAVQAIENEIETDVAGVQEIAGIPKKEKLDIFGIFPAAAGINVEPLHTGHFQALAQSKVDELRPAR